MLNVKEPYTGKCACTHSAGVHAIDNMRVLNIGAMVLKDCHVPDCLCIEFEEDPNAT